MSITKVLNSLEKSWKRDEILLKIKNGLDTDKIVNEFLANNEIQIKKLNTLLSPEDFDLLNQVEQLTTCCLLYTSPSPRDRTRSRMPSSA